MLLKIAVWMGIWSAGMQEQDPMRDILLHHISPYNEQLFTEEYQTFLDGNEPCELKEKFYKIIQSLDKHEPFKQQFVHYRETTPKILQELRDSGEIDSADLYTKQSLLEIKNKKKALIKDGEKLIQQYLANLSIEFPVTKERLVSEPSERRSWLNVGALAVLELHRTIKEIK